ncbi:MAG: hypothetical protein NTV21_09660 [Planctomycetota bacterium]|nr:hypothetical protein [Planctomycetota bacterium]
MADAKKDEKKDDKAAAPADPAKKKKLMAIGGVVGGLALAFVAAMFAVPKKEEVTKPSLVGPNVGPITPKKVQVNDSGGRGYIVFELNLMYDAYNPDYLASRASDPVCQAEILDALVTIASAKSRNDMTDKVGKPVFLEEVRAAIDPLVFPVCLGTGTSGTEADSESGLALGESMAKSTFRGLLEEHALHVDAVQKKLRADDGAEITFTGEERDLQVPCGTDMFIWLDVTGLKPEFVGEVKFGIRGRTRRVLWNEVLLQ